MEPLQWYIRRLSRMSGGEVLYRLGLAARTAIERGGLAAGSVKGLSVPRAGWNFSDLRGFGDLGSREETTRLVVDRFGWNERRAHQHLHHRLSFFSLADWNGGERIRWNYDYRNNIATPMEYGPTMDYRDPTRCGDIKYAWEHNRHQHLVELAKAFYLTGNRRYHDEVLDQVDSWIQECPYPYGINWSSALECSLRLISWCFALHFLRAADPDMQPARDERFKRWIASAHDHLRFITGRFSRYSSANNHLIGEACGVFFGAQCFTFDESPRWGAQARTILEREGERQVWPDGVGKEQAVWYQGFVFDLLVLAGLLAKGNGCPFAQSYWDRLERMAEFIATLISEDGRVPQIGDRDDGYVVCLSERSPLRHWPALLSTAAALFDRRDFREKAGTCDEMTFWLLGRAGMEAFEQASRSGDVRSEFRDGGYYILTGDRARAIVDCGPLGYTTLAAHGHADALSLVLEYEGKWFLVDPGSYAYHAEQEWRDYFRGTAAHNTLRLDGRNQSEIGGNFMWLEHARSELLSSGADRIVGRHDGYRRLPTPALHEREVAYERQNRRYRITDRILSDGTHRAELNFHLDPACECIPVEGGYELRNGGTRLLLLPDPKLQERNVLKGSGMPLAGWYSPAYDQKVPTVTLRFEGRTTGTTEFTTMLALL